MPLKTNKQKQQQYTIYFVPLLHCYAYDSTIIYILDDHFFFFSFCHAGIPTVYIVLNVFDKHASYNAPKYRCSDEKVATKVAQLINYAKNLYEEEKHVVRTFRLQQGTVLW